MHDRTQQSLSYLSVVSLLSSEPCDLNLSLVLLLWRRLPGGWEVGVDSNWCPPAAAPFVPCTDQREGSTHINNTASSTQWNCLSQESSSWKNKNYYVQKVDPPRCLASYRINWPEVHGAIVRLSYYIIIITAHVFQCMYARRTKNAWLIVWCYYMYMQCICHGHRIWPGNARLPAMQLTTIPIDTQPVHPYYM